MFGKKKIPEKLNICIVAKNFPMLGRSSEYGFLWPIARNLAKNHDVTVLAWSNPDQKIEILQDNVKAYFLYEKGQLKNFTKKVNNKFMELHENKPFHIVHSIDSSAIDISLNKKKHNAAVAYGVESTSMSQVFSIIGMMNDSLKSILSTSLAVAFTFLTTYFSRDRKLLKSADGIFVSTPVQKISLERYYLYPSKKTYNVPYGIEVTDLSPREKSDELRKKLNLPKHSKIAVSLIDMNEVSVIKSILKSFEKVAIKKPSARLILIGKLPLAKNIELMIYNLALGSKVIYVNSPSNMEFPDYTTLADVFINLSNQSSGYESTLLEAMAQRRVIIGSEASPISTIVTHNEDGFLVRPADTYELSQLILKIFNDEINVNDISNKAQENILSLFDMKKMLANMIDAYHNILLSTGNYKK